MATSSHLRFPEYHGLNESSGFTVAKSNLYGVMDDNIAQSAHITTHINGIGNHNTTVLGTRINRHLARHGCVLSRGERKVSLTIIRAYVY
jgi:hypothetical protein